MCVLAISPVDIEPISEGTVNTPHQLGKCTSSIYIAQTKHFLAILTRFWKDGCDRPANLASQCPSINFTPGMDPNHEVMALSGVPESNLLETSQRSYPSEEVLLTIGIITSTDYLTCPVIISVSFLFR